MLNTYRINSPERLRGLLPACRVLSSNSRDPWTTSETGCCRSDMRKTAADLRQQFYHYIASVCLGKIRVYCLTLQAVTKLRPYMTIAAASNANLICNTLHCNVKLATSSLSYMLQLVLSSYPINVGNEFTRNTRYEKKMTITEIGLYSIQIQ